MSYNLLLDTNFNKINRHWKLTNCKYEDGYLISNAEIFSIEQEIILPDPTKIYFSMDYICFDPNIKYIYCGIFTNDGTLESIRKHPSLKRRKRLSVVNSTEYEKIKVMMVFESKSSNSKIYVDSPLLIDLKAQNKQGWPKLLLDKYLYYKCGYEYENEYTTNEIKIDSLDFKSPYTKTEKGKIGIIATVVENDWFRISHNFKDGRYYLIKLDYEQINEYGQIYLSYGNKNSIDITKEQLYIMFKADSSNELRLNLKNFEKLPYFINLKHIMILDITDLKIGEDDIPCIPFI